MAMSRTATRSRTMVIRIISPYSFLRSTWIRPRTMHTNAEVALQVRTRSSILASECRSEKRNEGMSRVPSPNLSPLRPIIVSEGRHRRRMSMLEPCLVPVATNITNHSSMPRRPASSPKTNHARKKTKRRLLTWVPSQLSYWTGR